MVRAILDGRKTQTRRVINPQPIWVADPSVPFKTTDADPMGIINCQHGKPGDRLWVRETWQGYKRVSYEYNEWEEAECVKDVAENGYTSFVYKADGKNFPDKWLPSIHMPRIASRITLGIVSVRVERLQDISEHDAIAEGCIKFPFYSAYTFHDNDKSGHATHTGAYRKLWESLNGTGSWDLNPWVWVIEFKRVNNGFSE